MLDLVLFGAFKHRIVEDENTDHDLVTTISGILKKYEQTMISPSIRGAFVRGGFFYDVAAKPYRLRFNEDKLRAEEGFQELWNIDAPMESLSLRRQASAFGWINQ
jgi:hypothetical protein